MLLPHIVLRTVVLLILAASLSGCRSGVKPINPKTGIVDIKVWLVLAAGDVIGFDDNRGCRLRPQDAGPIVRSLLTNQGIFGQYTMFNFDNTITTIIDSQYPLGNMRTQSFQQWDNPSFLVYEDGNLDPNAINIYFVGNVQIGGNIDGETVALTSDPARAATVGIFDHPPPVILINDGGFAQDFGFDPDFAPPLRPMYLTLEHEMTHYLARFNNQLINGTQYTGEHAPPGSNNILVPFAIPPPPLVIPGSSNDPATEKGMIWIRIWNGQWNNP